MTAKELRVLPKENVTDEHGFTAGQLICPDCRSRPKVKRKSVGKKTGVSKYYLSYCAECQRGKRRESQQRTRLKMAEKRKRTHKEILVGGKPDICPSCEKNKRQSNGKFCTTCYEQASFHQPAIWDRVAYKLEDLLKFISDHAEFPPEYTVNTRARILDGLVTLKIYLRKIEGGGG